MSKVTIFVINSPSFLRVLRASCLRVLRGLPPAKLRQQRVDLIRPAHLARPIRLCLLNRNRPARLGHIPTTRQVIDPACGRLAAMRNVMIGSGSGITGAGGSLGSGTTMAGGSLGSGTTIGSFCLVF